MAAVTEHPKTQTADMSEQVDKFDPGQNSARRAIAACAGGSLYMAALGIWLVPAEDSATQLIKLVASCVMVAGGAYLFHGVAPRFRAPEVQVDLKTRQLRVYEYDTVGRSVLKTTHGIDALQELSLNKNRLRARDEQGEVMLDVPIGTTEGKALMENLKSLQSGQA